MANIAAAYQASKGSPLDVDRAFYQRIAHEHGLRTLVDKLVVPIRSGRAWHVPAGHVFRIVTHRWSAGRRPEYLELPQSARAHVGLAVTPAPGRACQHLRSVVVEPAVPAAAGDDHRRQLWPAMASTTFGGRVHDLLGTRCDPYVNRMLTGEDFHFHCHSNLVRAVVPYGLTEFDVHDVLNVFQVTGLNSDDQYFMRACPAKPGDHLEFFAEIDLLCAHLRLSRRRSVGAAMGARRARPAGGVPAAGRRSLRARPAAADGWKSPEVATYRGAHGLHVEQGAWEK